jgi:hypothetical protein
MRMIEPQSDPTNEDPVDDVLPDAKLCWYNLNTKALSICRYGPLSVLEAG